MSAAASESNFFSASQQYSQRLLDSENLFANKSVSLYRRKHEAPLLDGVEVNGSISNYRNQPTKPSDLAASSNTQAGLKFTVSTAKTAQKQKFSQTVNQILFDEKVGHKVEDAEKKYGFNDIFFKRLWYLLHFMPANSFILLLLILALHGVYGYLTTYSFPMQVGIVFTDIIMQNNQETAQSLVDLIVIVTLISSSFALIGLSTSYFANEWRAALTERTQRKLFVAKRLYTIECVDTDIDNYDQRLADSCRNFTNGFVGCIFGTALLPIASSLVGNVMQLVVSFLTIAYAADIMATVLIVYGVVFCVLLVPQFSVVSRLQFQLNEFEGYFRFTHTKVRTFCESIAFYGGDLKEKTGALDDYAKVYHTSHKFAWSFSWLNVTTQFFYAVNAQANSSMSTIGSFVTVWWMMSSGTVFPLAKLNGTLLQLKGLLMCIAGIPQNFSTLAPVSGECHRLCELMERLDTLEALEASGKLGVPAKASSDGNVLQLDGVRIKTPGQSRFLVSGLNLALQPAQSINIQGTNASGKSAIVRAIAGLWTDSTEGAIAKPSISGPGGLFCVPQTAYAVKGSLFDQVIYPQTRAELCEPSACSLDHGSDPVVPAALEARVRWCLQEVGLAGVCERMGLHEVRSWDDVLSGGEKQRLGLARVLFTRPAVALLDECTSALDVKTEQQCLSALAKLTAAPAGSSTDSTDSTASANAQGTAYVYIGNRAALQTHSQITLDLGLLKKGAANAVSCSTQPARVSGSPPAHPLSCGQGTLGAEPEAPNKAKDVKETESTGADSGSAVDAQALAKENRPFFSRLVALLCIGFPIFSTGWWYAALGFAAHVSTALVLWLAVPINSRLFGVVAMYSPSINTNAEFKSDLWQLIAMVLLVNVTNFCGLYLGRKAAIHLRRNLEICLHDLYFANNVFYTVTALDGRLDNVDNRITNDMELLSFTFSNFFFGDGLITPWSGGLLNIIAIAVVFTVQGYVAGYWLDISLVYIYTFVTAVGVLPLLKWVAGAAYERQVAEGEFRYLHGYVRSYAESITVLCGQRAEYALATRSLQSLRALVNKWVLAIGVALQFNGWCIYTAALFLPNFLAYLASIYTPYLMPVSQESDNITLVTTRTATVSSLLRVVGVLPFLMGRATDMTAAVHRIMETVEVCEDLSQQKLENLEGRNSKLRDAPDRIEFQRVCVQLPRKVASGPSPRLLFRDLSFSLVPGDSTVIMGPSGCGKSSLLRVIGGLWDAHSGVVCRPSEWGPGGLFFLPQRGFLTRGTLRDLVVYPLVAADCSASDSALVQQLEFVGLGSVVQEFGLHSQQEWLDVLSAGQTQRLGFARLFFHAPLFALMDEATSALDEDSEAVLLAHCVKSRITMISVAHRLSVLKHHKQVFVLDGKGSLNIVPTNEFVHEAQPSH